MLTLTLALCAGLLASPVQASPEVDQLAESAAKGDAAAIKSLVELSRKRDADAEYALGLMAHEGRGLQRNLRQAFRLVERAAGRGHVEAQNTLGYFHQHGLGTVANAGQALTWYRRSAEAGNPRAQVNMGWLYEQGLVRLEGFTA